MTVESRCALRGGPGEQSGWSASARVLYAAAAMHGTRATRFPGLGAVLAAGAAIATLLVLPGPPASAQAGGDYDPTSDSWNGLSRLLSIATEERVAVEPARRLDLGTLGVADGLLILCPTAELPVEGITDMLRAGGRVVLADDFGTGDSLLRAFHIDRHDARPTGVPALRGNDALLVATRRVLHPLSVGVDSIVTNHPRALSHAELEPIFELGAGDALVLAGAVGSGRLVVLADPSVLIDNMLELGGNRRFAANLLRYLAGDDGTGRVLVVLPEGELVGRFGEPGADRPLHALRALLERLGSAELPPLALRGIALFFLLVLLVVATGALPRASPYTSSALFAPATLSGGLAGRVAWYGGGTVDLLDPLLSYKRELETELSSRLRLAQDATVGDMTAALRARGVDKARIDDARLLLIELARILERAERDPEPVGPSRLRELVRRGDALLAVIGTGPAAGARASA